MATEATWEPHEKHGHLTMQGDLPETVFAFPEQRKEPLTNSAATAAATRRAHARATTGTDQR